MRHVVVGTAGHIDHGKSALVRALTGTDPDRLKEEKARGITVDLGFAHFVAGGVRYAFVDVPGHERFVRNMLAGAGGFDVVLLVVAADESVMPQTREHFEICRLLGIGTAVVALSRSDLVDDPDLIELAELEVRDLLAGSPLAEAPVVPVSSVTGAGLDRLLAALETAAAAARPRDPDGLFRLPVDRVFSVRGFGAVVTGTVVSGRVAVGSEVEILPGRDGGGEAGAGERARVRGLEVHGAPAETGSAGERVALNLSGVRRERVERGSVVGSPGELGAGSMLDCRLEVLPGAGAPVGDEDRVHVHLGAAAALARVRLLGGAAAVEPGETVLAQLRLESPVAALRGDRFIVRRYSPVVTIGGGEVVDAFPPKRSPKSPAAREAVAALAEADDREAALLFVDRAGPGGLTEAALARRLGRPRGEAHGLVAELAEAGSVGIAAGRAAGDSLLVSAARLRALGERLLARLAAFEAANRLRPGMAVEELRERAGVPAAVADRVMADLAAAGRLRRDRDAVSTAGREVELTDREREVRDELARRLEEAGLAPPTLADAARELEAPAPLVDAMRRLLAHEGRAVVVTADLAFDAGALRSLREAVRDRRAVNPEVSVGWFKEEFGLSRKHAIPLLEWLDRERVTVRVGDVRRILARAAPSSSSSAAKPAAAVRGAPAA